MNIYSQGEREKMLSESNGFLFYGTERLLSYYEATKIPTFNLNSMKSLKLFLYSSYNFKNI